MSTATTIMSWETPKRSRLGSDMDKENQNLYDVTPNTNWIKMSKTPSQFHRQQRQYQNAIALDRTPISGSCGVITFGHHYTPGQPTKSRRSKPRRKSIVFKSQSIPSKADVNHICYRELLVYKALAQLSLPNFVHINEWYKDLEDGKHVMTYVLEKADKTMKELVTENEKCLELSTMRSILFQIFFALHIAQTRCCFGHNDLHFKNILLKKRSDDVDSYMYTLDREQWLVDCDYVVKLNDFGNSSLSLPNGTKIENPKAGTFGMFLAHRDGNKIRSELKGVKLKGDISKTEKRVWTSFLRKMSKEHIPLSMLHHEFFDCLRCQSSNGSNSTDSDASTRKSILVAPATKEQYRSSSVAEQGTERVTRRDDTAEETVHVTTDDDQRKEILQGAPSALSRRQKRRSEESKDPSARRKCQRRHIPR